MKLTSFRAGAGLLQTIRKLAREHERSMAAEIRFALRLYIEGEGGKINAEPKKRSARQPSS